MDASYICRCIDECTEALKSFNDSGFCQSDIVRHAVAVRERLRGVVAAGWDDEWATPKVEEYDFDIADKIALGWRIEGRQLAEFLQRNPMVTQ